MEANTNFIKDHNTLAPPNGFYNINSKPEIQDDDFSIDNLSLKKSYLQDFHNLDQFPFTTALFNQDIGIQANCFDPVGPFTHGSSIDFDLYENESIRAAMQDLQGGGFFNFPDRKDSLMEIETALMYHDTKPLNLVAPDESSCVTADNLGCHKRDGREKSKDIIQKCIRGQKKHKSAKGQWTIDEDRLLIHLVGKYGERKWSTIAQVVKGRIGKQCRERWHNHLRPDIKKDLWTEEEDRILIETHVQVGNKWAEIAKSLPGRTENSIKNHWNATKRRQFSRRNCRTKWPKPSSLLQNYIKSLNFENKSGRLMKNIQPPSTTYPGIHNNKTSFGAPKNPEIEFRPDNHMVPEYDFGNVSEFTCNDNHLFKDGSMDSLMDDIQINEIGDNQCCDVDLPFDMPLLAQYDLMKELDSFDGK
ncbi:transcription factor myb98 [Phtheirospermum japonicum]|uniref:Transcription factor myb98 n=1 Tax=Phtheirospermum japonicum TaxID=374723 RepID=A0A830B042_9LAMI|nr:transcription factor myb98 [Phtheirospermum japonicum]